MSKRPPLLLIGILPPTPGSAAAATVQTALVLAQEFSVTILVSDTAPPTNIFRDNPAIDIIRTRNLMATPDVYKNHKRLYILDDSYLSLFALELYQQAPGIIWSPGSKLNRLIQDYFASQPGWPDTYGDWLIEQLGTEGETISHGLLHHRRLSTNLNQELPSPSEGSSFRQTKANLISVDDVFSPPDLFIAAPPAALPRGQYRAELDVPEDAILIVATQQGAERKAADALKNLRSPISSKMVFKFISEGEENLASLVCAADILLVISATNFCPITVALGMAQGKAMIVCSKPWSAKRGARNFIQLPHPEALHQMVAAVAALSQDTTLREWYGQNITESVSQQGLQDISGLLKERLKAKQPPLAVFEERATTATADATWASQQNTQRITSEGGSENRCSDHNKAGAALQEGPRRSVALIGAVPPRPLVEKFFPEVDWEISPRFATLDLAHTLCADAPEQTANKLALLGYSTPIVRPENSVKAAEENTPFSMRTSSWSDLQKDFRATNEALCFGCNINGAVRANLLIEEKSRTGNQLNLVFNDDESLKVLKHYEESCGLFWQLDPVRHQITCMIVAGLAGQYQLSLENRGCAVLVSSSTQSLVLSIDQPAVLEANNLGLLSFVISALDAESGAPQTHDFLTKTLAHSGLILEWLNHG